MRVAHLTTTDISLRYLVLPQLEAVLDAGGEALGISADGPFVSEIEARGVRHIALSASTRGAHPLADVRAALQLWRVLRRERPDVLHTHNPKPGIYGRIVGRLAGVPLIVNTVHGLYATPDDGLPRRAVVYLLEAIASRFSHAELVQNEEDLALLTRWHISPRSKTRLLGNGVDLKRFAPPAEHLAATARNNARAQLGIGAGDDDRPVIGFVGRLVREKGLPELFEAAKLLGQSAVVVCIGPDDPDKADAISPDERAAAAAAGVRFTGFRSDVAELYPAMDVFVLPSHREGYPRSAMEAAACGTPVVATDIRGCRQVVDDGVTGILVPVRNAERLATALGDLVQNADRRHAMGDAARERAERCFDERAVVERVMLTYSEAPTRVRSRPVAKVTKRALDVVVAAGALVILSPVLALVAVLVRIALGRPVLFRQARPGLRGRPFTIYKFRTMRDGDGPDHQRLTRVGRWLRSTSLDELPELVNVLRGDMSIVGPRPLLPQYLDRYTADQARRHDVRPGLTGWAQIHGRNATSWDERLTLDVWYVSHWSVLLDLRIIAATARLLLTRQGISHDGHATMPELPERADAPEKIV